MRSVSIGINRLVGDKLVFCNADRGLLVGTETEVRAADLDRLPALRIVAPCSVGVDPVDAAAAEPESQTVRNGSTSASATKQDALKKN